mgnify:CR=1 FL=1
MKLQNYVLFFVKYEIHTGIILKFVRLGPYLLFENYSYFFLDYTTVPNMVLDLSKDGYTQYYGHAFKGQDREEMKEYHKKVIEPSITKFKHKIIYGRP